MSFGCIFVKLIVCEHRTAVSVMAQGGVVDWKVRKRQGQKSPGPADKGVSPRRRGRGTTFGGTSIVSLGLVRENWVLCS